MGELVLRALRDGALEGEQAVALTIKDIVESPFGFDVFNYFFVQLSSNILGGKSQSRGLVLVAFSRSPSFYVDLLESKGIDASSPSTWIQILDCYTDPLGWKDRLMGCGTITNHSWEASSMATVCKNVRNVDMLFSSIVELGKGLVGEGKNRFSLAIDSVSELLRHASMSSVAALLSNLRSHDKVSSAFWLLHSDLHESRPVAVLEYMSSMVASLEPIMRQTEGQKGGSDSQSLRENNPWKGKFHARIKRRNGKVRLMCEEFYVEQSGIRFSSASAEVGIFNQGLLPKVQFNLQLSEKERTDRANVVLPFEHQGDGKAIQIYDGRRSPLEGNNHTAPASSEKLQTSDSLGKGEIIYFRDSDDEMPDSDEDPDNDLDI